MTDPAITIIERHVAATDRHIGALRGLQAAYDDSIRHGAAEIARLRKLGSGPDAKPFAPSLHTAELSSQSTLTLTRR